MRSVVTDSASVCVSVCWFVTMVEPIEMLFGIWTWVGLHIGASWQIGLNHPCVAEIRPYIKLL